MQFTIVRRAYSQWEAIASVPSTWVNAMDVAEAMQRQNRDGEYSVRFPHEPLQGVPAPYGQSGMDYL